MLEAGDDGGGRGGGVVDRRGQIVCSGGVGEGSHAMTRGNLSQSVRGEWSLRGQRWHGLGRIKKKSTSDEDEEKR